MADQLHENAIRLIRQRLIALEDSRKDDAATIERFLETDYGITIEDVEVSKNYPKFDDTLDPRSAAGRQARQERRWHQVYGVPEGTKTVTVLVTHAREPVFRIPTDLETRGVSWMELPIPEDGPTEGVPEHLHPQKLPPRVEKALRLA